MEWGGEVGIKEREENDWLLFMRGSQSQPCFFIVPSEPETNEKACVFQIKYASMHPTDEIHQH